MTNPIHPKNTGHIARSQPKEVYDRVLHEMKMTVEAAAGDIIVDNIPNYRAVLQTARSQKNHRISASPKNKSAGKADHQAIKLFQHNNAFLAQAKTLRRTAPFSLPKH